MCEYVQYTPFSYDAFYTGTTGRVITEYTDFADAAKCDDGTDTTTLTGSAVADGLVTVGGLAAGNATATRNFSSTYCDSGDCIADSEATDVCSFNYGNLNDSFPNADSGNVTIRTVSCSFDELDTDDPVDGIPNITECDCSYTEETVNCNGDATNALAGAKRSSSLDVGQTSVITPSFVGMDATESIESPISKQYTSNRFISNFISTQNYATIADNSCHASNFHMDTYGLTAGSLSTNRSDWGDYSNAVDPFGNSNSGTHDNYYTFNCLDAAFNIKARIRVLVRDWDREFTPEDSEIENLNPVAKLNDVTTTCFGLNCDGFYDHDTRWSLFGLANTTAPLYNSCGEGATNVIASTALTNTPTLSITGGDGAGTLSGALTATEAFPSGTMIYIESGVTGGFDAATDIPLMTLGGSGAAISFASLPGFSAAGLDFYIVRKLHYAVENPD